jgi:DNA polymerase III epsilon subunit-like protein
MPLALVFDVETTGLLPKYNGAPLTEFPHIIQFSYLLYDSDTWAIKRVYNEYIKTKETISPKITEITGITREIVDSRGIHICEALQEFFHAYMEADVLVGHNLDFDMKMLLAESARWGLNQIVDTFEEHCKLGNNDSKKLFDTSNPNFYCTMMHGIEMCKLERTNSRGVYLKQPKLSELYQHIFELDPPEGLHNSLIDVLVCLRCYMDMAHQVRLGDDMFTEMLVRYK